VDQAGAVYVEKGQGIEGEIKGCKKLQRSTAIREAGVEKVVAVDKEGVAVLLFLLLSFLLLSFSFYYFIMKPFFKSLLLPFRAIYQTWQIYRYSVLFCIVPLFQCFMTFLRYLTDWFQS
jgi:hypothetical protein